MDKSGGKMEEKGGKMGVFFRVGKRMKGGFPGKNSPGKEFPEKILWKEFPEKNPGKTAGKWTKIPEKWTKIPEKWTKMGEKKGENGNFFKVGKG